MAGTDKVVRLSKAAREFNISLDTIIEFLSRKGFDVVRNPNTKLNPDMYELLTTEFQQEKEVKEIAQQIGLEFLGKETISIEDTYSKEQKAKTEDFDQQDELFITNTGYSYTKEKEVAKPKPEAAPKVTSKAEPLVEPEVKKEEEDTKKAEAAVTKETAKKVAVEATPEKAEEKPTDIPESPISKEEDDTPAAKDKKEEIADTKVEPVEKATDEFIKKEDTEAVSDEGDLDEPADDSIKVLGKIDLDTLNQKTRPKKKTKAEKRKDVEDRKKSSDKSKPVPEEVAKEDPVAAKAEDIVTTTEEVAEKKEVDKAVSSGEASKPEHDINFLPTQFQKLSGPKVLDKIILPIEIKPKKKKPVASSADNKVDSKKKRRRIPSNTPKQAGKPTTGGSGEGTAGSKDKRPRPGIKKREAKPELTEEQIQKQIKETLARLAPTGKSKSAKYRRQKRDHASQTAQEEIQRQEDEKLILKVTEFVTANELSTMMNVGVTEIIKTCMQLGLFVSINQRLDAETIALVAEEFGYKVDFVSVDDSKDLEVEEEVDTPESLVDRSPIVTVMGHVDHGKTKLLDYIRKANVVAGEAGGITQHIGAYEVTTESGKTITFLDTPGHEAFTAMRARGAKVTDIAIIVIAADDSVMPQTKEAINHAQAAGVPIVFAFNKMDKEGANSDKIKEQLSQMNILTEDWGGKFQSQEISAITGAGISDLLEKVLLEAEMLELKANPNKPGKGTVIEASLDKGRGYVATVLVQEGTMSKGDILLAGPVFGKVKAMFNERNKGVDIAGPSTPVLLLGLISAPQAGDTFNVMLDEKEAKNLANKRHQLIREQSLRTQKHITLDEIGRRIAIGDFKELNVIVKGDVDGSVEALSDELLKLSTEEVQVNVIHKAVGAITESDVMLASASDAIIIGFQVRPVPQARKLAEQEQIDIRLYSIIYKATEELQTAIEGMHTPKMVEKIICNIEVRDVFHITKVGTIAGCYVLDGKVTRNTKIRVIRDGIVVHTGVLGSLKRFKDDVKEVSSGYECGLNIANFNDTKVGDIVEGYEEVEVKR